VSAKDNAESKGFEGLVAMDKRSAYHSATQNAAFSVNVPRFDLRYQLKDIKVKEKTTNILLTFEYI
jgi:hypothetical protein